MPDALEVEQGQEAVGDSSPIKLFHHAADKADNREITSDISNAKEVNKQLMRTLGQSERTAVEVLRALGQSESTAAEGVDMPLSPVLSSPLTLGASLSSWSLDMPLPHQ